MLNDFTNTTVIPFESLTVWLYPLSIVFGIVFLGALLGLVKRAKQPLQEKKTDRTPYLLTLITSAIALFMCFEMMFLRFSSLEIKSEKIEISYVWPRPSISIPKSSFRLVEVSRDSKGRGNLTVVTKDGSYKSAAFNRFLDAEGIKVTLEEWAVSNP